MTISHDDPRLLAYALGELDGDDLLEIDAAVSGDDELQRLVDEYVELARSLQGELAAESEPVLTPDQRQELLGGTAAATHTDESRDRLVDESESGLPLDQRQELQDNSTPVIDAGRRRSFYLTGLAALLAEIGRAHV